MPAIQKTQSRHEYLRQMTSQLPSQEALWATPLDELLPLWQKVENLLGTDQAVRLLVKLDRFYLLTVCLRRHDLWHPWTYDRCREVEREPDGYIDLWAREHGKSSVITIGGIIQEVLKDPELTVGIFSHKTSIATEFLAVIKQEFESNQKLKDAFPDVLWANPAKDAAKWSLERGIVVKRKSNPKEGTVEAHGLVDGQPTGAHFGLLVYDDVVTRESVSTPEQVAKTTAAWELSDNLGTINGRKWMIGTRYSYADSYETIMKRGAAQPRIYPATDDGTIHGSPVYLPIEVWNRKVRDQGEATIACQMLQNPLAGAQRMFDIENLGVYEIRPATLNVYLLIDPARSKKKDSDNTAMAVLGIDHALNKYLLDGYNHKMDLQERWTHMRDLYVKWLQAPGVQNLKVGYEIYGAQADMDYFKERQQVEKLPFEIVELAWPNEGGGSKIDRVQRLVPDVRNHRVFLPYNTDPNKLTATQAGIIHGGHGYRVARPIKRRDHENNIYDLSAHLREQIHYFPFGSLKDLVDAVARIYDIEATAPLLHEQGSFEPDY